MFQVCVFSFQMSFFNLDFVCELYCCVNELQSGVGSISLLLYHSDILPQSLVRILQLLLEAFDLLILQVLCVGLLLGKTSP